MKKREIIKEYHLRYGNIEKVYRDYMSIDEDIRKGFSNMIDTETIITFIISGTNIDSLRLIWERISIYLEKYDKDTIDILKNTFDLFFDIFNSVYKLYSRNNTLVGDKFSINKHSKIQGSKSSGEVEDVLLDGYINMKTSKIIKSIVRV